MGVGVGAANSSPITSWSFCCCFWSLASTALVVCVNARTCGALATVQGSSGLRAPTLSPLPLRRLVSSHTRAFFSSCNQAALPSSRGALDDDDDDDDQDDDQDDDIIHGPPPYQLPPHAPTASPMSSSPSWTAPSLPNDRQTLL